MVEVEEAAAMLEMLAAPSVLQYGRSMQSTFLLWCLPAGVEGF